MVGDSPRMRGGKCEVRFSPVRRCEARSDAARRTLAARGGVLVAEAI